MRVGEVEENDQADCRTLCLGCVKRHTTNDRTHAMKFNVKYCYGTNLKALLIIRYLKLIHASFYMGSFYGSY